MWEIRIRIRIRICGRWAALPAATSPSSTLPPSHVSDSDSHIRIGDFDFDSDSDQNQNQNHISDSDQNQNQNQNQNHISDSDSHIRIGDSDSDQQLYLSSLVPLIFLTQIPCLRKYDYSIVTCQHRELWFQFQISNQIYVNFAPRLKIQKLADVFLYKKGRKIWINVRILGDKYVNIRFIFRWSFTPDDKSPIWEICVCYQLPYLILGGNSTSSQTCPAINRSPLDSCLIGNFEKYRKLSSLADKPKWE